MDTHLGRSPIKDYIPANYKGQCFAILCKPTLTGGTGATAHEILTPHDIEQVYYMDGVFPTTIPDDAFSTDIATNDVAQLSVTFSFDGGFHTKESNGVVDEAIKRMTELATANGSHIDSYKNSLDEMGVGVGALSSNSKTDAGPEWSGQGISGLIDGTTGKPI